MAIGDSVSDPVGVEFGVPQGSVIGPKLYTINVDSIRKVAEGNGVWLTNTLTTLQFILGLDFHLRFRTNSKHSAYSPAGRVILSTGFF